MTPVTRRLLNWWWRRGRPMAWRLRGHNYGEWHAKPFPGSPTDAVLDRTLIIISCPRRPACLTTLLDSLTQHPEPRAYDVLVVNDGTRPDIADVAARHGAMTLSRVDTYTDRGGHDAGMSRCPNYRYYLCMDDDTYAVRDRWLSGLIELVEQDAQVGAAGNHYVAMRDYYAAGHEPYERRLREILHAAGCLDRPDGCVDFLESASILLRRDVLLEAGMWRLFEPGDRFATLLSEVEMSVRLRQMGYRLAAPSHVLFGHKNHRFATLPPEIIPTLDSYAARHGGKPR